MGGPLSKPYRLAYFVSHPIQYQAPLLRALASRPEIDLEVFFYSDFSVAGYQDKEFGRTVEWDVPLTEGYRHTFLNRVASGAVREAVANRPNAAFWQEIPRRLSEGRFDAVWVHGWAHWQSLQAVWAARRLGVTTLLRGETNALAPAAGGWRGHLKHRLRETLLDWLFSRVDGFLAVGLGNRRFYEGRGVPTSRIFRVPYVVDNAFFQARAAKAHPEREALRAELGLPPGRPVILFAAKLIEKKRPQDLLEAYCRLSPDGGTTEPGACLLFVGDGALGPKLQAAADRTGWHSIRFAGFRNQSQMPAFYDLSDVLVLPSDFEPWGLVLNEAMNAAKPLIVSDRIGAAADLLQPGENGFVYPAGDVAALTERLRDVLLAPPSRREQMGRKSLEIINGWSLEVACRGVVEALTTLCPGGRHGGRPS